MFTGLVKCVGRVAAREARGGDQRLRIAAPALFESDQPVAAGASIAVNGVCLTAAVLGDREFAADVSQETLQHTTLGELEPGSRVNLEPSLRLADPLGGHLVSGHVDGIGTVGAITPDGRSARMEFVLPDALMRYLARKGSVAIDGTSLTVNAVRGSRISVNIVPHTIENTIIGAYRTGTQVNLEVDMVARYVERLLEGRDAS